MTAVQPPTTRPPDGSRSTGSRALWWGLVVLVMIIVGVGVFLLAGRDDDSDSSSTTSTTTTETPTSGTAPTSTPSTTSTVDRSTAVWPAEGSGAAFTDPVAAATAFASEFLHFQSPVVGPFQQGDSRSGEVEVRAATNGAVTTILVRQLSGEDTWSVLGAATELIQITAPAAGATVASPLELRGSALAFEGTVQVEVRADGQDAPIGSGFVTGGGDVLRPFEGSVAFTTPPSTHGALVLYTVSMEDGRVWSASVIRVAFEAR